MKKFAIVLGMGFSVVFAGSRYGIGTSSSLFSELKNKNPGLTKAYSLTTSSTEKIALNVKDYYFEAGYLSMVGTTQESSQSDFMLKGTEENIYGWLVMRNRNIAYEYTTDSFGNLWSEEVPVTKIFPICSFPESHLEEGASKEEQGVRSVQDTLIPHLGDYNGTDDINKLQSLPGAKKVLYVNIAAIQSKAKAELWKLWQIQAASLSSFEVNVTTDPAVYKAAGVANSGSSKFINSSGRSSCGVNAWGSTQACNLYLDGPGTGLSMGTVCVHEVGHLLGLAHDGGSPGGEYHTGFKAYKWLPVMGNSWSADNWGTEPLLQWSKGEYTGSSTQQDDLEIIGRKLISRVDDIPSTIPLSIGSSGVVSGLSNRGLINKNTDSDVFTFTIGTAGSRAKLKIGRIEHYRGSMLDIEAILKNSSGTEIARNNMPVLRHAEFDQELPIGNYTLTIQGGFEGTPQNGFSKYSSLGWYEISGTVSGATPIKDSKNIQNAKTLLDEARLTDGQLKLNLPIGSQVKNFALHAMDGTQVFHSQNRIEFIDLRTMNRGVYLFSMELEGSRITKSFLKF